jgi:hypothetical protein
MIFNVSSTIRGNWVEDDGITEKQFNAFVSEISEVCKKYKLAFGGFDNGLYIYSIKNGFCICDDGDVDFVGDGELKIKKLTAEFSKEKEEE